VVALRCLYLIALVFWVGGMLALGALAAPATVNVLEAGDVFSERLTTSLLLLNLGGGLSLIYWEARERIA